MAEGHAKEYRGAGAGGKPHYQRAGLVLYAWISGVYLTRDAGIAFLEGLLAEMILNLVLGDLPVTGFVGARFPERGEFTKGLRRDPEKS